jgi:hypothetical protein
MDSSTEFDRYRGGWPGGVAAAGPERYARETPPARWHHISAKGSQTCEDSGRSRSLCSCRPPPYPHSLSTATPSTGRRALSIMARAGASPTTAILTRVAGEPPAPRKHLPGPERRAVLRTRHNPTPSQAQSTRGGRQPRGKCGEVVTSERSPTGTNRRCGEGDSRTAWVQRPRQTPPVGRGR